MIDGMRVSVTCGVRDRTERLVASLRTWMDCPEVDEIVVVDWSSEEPVELGGINYDSRRWRGLLWVAHVDGQEHWVASKCHNLELQLTTGDLVLRLDTARDDNETHLAGVVYAARKDFLAVNGYNERIAVYGYEDTDIVERMRDSGLFMRCLDYDTLHHVPHGEDDRFAHQSREEHDRLHQVHDTRSWSFALLKFGDRSIAANQKSARERPWTNANRRTVWKVTSREGRLICEEIPKETE